jgi:hypothetical protein
MEHNKRRAGASVAAAPGVIGAAPDEAIRGDASDALGKALQRPTRNKAVFVSEDLHNALKVEAAKARKTLGELVEEKLQGGQAAA